MALRSHTVGQMAKEIQDGLDSGNFKEDDTLAVKIHYDKEFVDYLSKQLEEGEDSVALLPLSLNSSDGPLWVTIEANAKKDA